MISTATSLAIMLAVTAISAGLSAYSSVSAANAREDSAKYNAAVAKNNAMAAADQSQFEADRIRDRNRRMAARQRNNIMSSGITLSGSGQDVVADSATQGELDVMSALYTGNISSMNQTARAKLFQMEGKEAKKAGYIGVGTSILGAASSGMSAYTNPSLNPGFGK